MPPGEWELPRDSDVSGLYGLIAGTNGRPGEIVVNTGIGLVLVATSPVMVAGLGGMRAGLARGGCSPTRTSPCGRVRRPDHAVQAVFGQPVNGSAVLGNVGGQLRRAARRIGRHRRLFEARVPLESPIDVGATPDGQRMIFVVKGGRFDGPRLRGEVMAHSGADWARIRPDGVGDLDVRMCLQTDDGARIYVHWRGLMVAAPEHLDYALDFAKPDDPAGAHRYYFRTNPRFETGDERYGWLNRLLAVSVSRTGDNGVVHRVFALR
jgi:hypothetical protein